MVLLCAADMMVVRQTFVSRRGGSVFGPEKRVGAKCRQPQNALIEMVCNLLTVRGNAAAISITVSELVVVENNLLGTEIDQTKAAQAHGADVLSCNDAPGGAACKRSEAVNKAYAGALATSSVALLPGGAQAMWGLGASANAGISYLVNGTIDPTNAVVAGWTNVITMGSGFWSSVGWNAAGGALANQLNGDDPVSGAITNGIGAGFGYGIGNGLKWGVNTGANWLKGGWDPKFNADLRQFTEVKGDFGLSKEMTPSNILSPFGDLGGSVFSEVIGKGIEKISSSSSKNNGDKK